MPRVVDLSSRARYEFKWLSSRLLGRFGSTIHSLTALAYSSGLLGPRAKPRALRTAARLNGTALQAQRRASRKR